MARQPVTLTGELSPAQLLYDSIVNKKTIDKRLNLPITKEELNAIKEQAEREGHPTDPTDGLLLGSSELRSPDASGVDIARQTVTKPIPDPTRRPTARVGRKRKPTDTRTAVRDQSASERNARSSRLAEQHEQRPIGQPTREPESGQLGDIEHSVERGTVPNTNEEKQRAERNMEEQRLTALDERKLSERIEALEVNVVEPPTDEGVPGKAEKRKLTEEEKSHIFDSRTMSEDDYVRKHFEIKGFFDVPDFVRRADRD